MAGRGGRRLCLRDGAVGCLVYRPRSLEGTAAEKRGPPYDVYAHRGLQREPDRVQVLCSIARW